MCDRRDRAVAETGGVEDLQSYFPTASPEALKALKLYFERDKNRGAGWAITLFDYVMTEKEKKPET